MLSDLIEEHGPLAASAMSSPTHTTTFVLPAQQTSPAQLAGLAPDSHLDPLGCSFKSQQQQQQLNDSAAQQLAWPTTDASVAAGIAAGDLMTFQVDGEIKLGLRPRQLTFLGSAQQTQQQQQQPPQLGQQLYGSSEALPAAELAPANANLPNAAAELYPEAAHSELSSVPLLSSRAASNASNAFADMAAAGTAAAMQTGTALAPAMPPQSGQVADDLQQEGSPLSTVPVSVVMTEAAEAQTGQQLTDVAPSLSWPAAAAPSRQVSGLPPPLSRQQSNLPPPLPRQPSAVVSGPVRQTSAVAAAAAPSRLSSTATNWQHPQQQQPVPLSRQVSSSHQSASRQGSGAQLPLSRHASTPAAQHSATAEEPEQAAAACPGQGLEQAWAALLPSLLASASQQHSNEPAMLPSAQLPTASLQQGSNAGAKQQTVGDILKMWAPIAKPRAAGNKSRRHDNEYGRLTGPHYLLKNFTDGAVADSLRLLCI